MNLYIGPATVSLFKRFQEYGLQVLYQKQYQKLHINDYIFLMTRHLVQQRTFSS